MMSVTSYLDDNNVTVIAGKQIKDFLWFVQSSEWIAGIQGVWSLSALHPGAEWHSQFDDDSLCLGYQYKVSLLEENQAKREL